jgi:molybdate transport system substrate-binding protein
MISKHLQTISPSTLLNFSVLLSSSIVWALLGSLVLCSQAHSEIMVAAASDLMPLQQPLSQGFQKVTGTSVKFTFGASGMLARQIENGAPYDVFLSADEERIKGLVSSGHILSDSVVFYARGRLGLWSKSGKIRTIFDLLRPEVRHVAIANPTHAPYGRAARQALEDQGFWGKLQPKIVYGENVRQALEFAETGNADATITAWSLVYNKRAILLPAEWHKPIRQFAGVVKGNNTAAGRRFLALLTSREGRELMQTHGLESNTKALTPER